MNYFIDDCSTEEIQIYEELKILYNYLLDEIVKLINLYHLTKPLEISCLYYYLLQHNYFKNGINENKKIGSSVLESYDIRGVNTIGNNGVCRHKSSMLNDIFNKLNIDSMILSGFITNNLKITSCNSRKYNDMVIAKSLNDNLLKGGSSNGIFKIIREKNFSYIIGSMQDKDYRTFKANHAIVLAGIDKKIFFDPQNLTYYELVDGEKITLRNKTGTYFFILSPEIKGARYFFYNDDENLLNLYNNFSKKECLEEKTTLKEVENNMSFIKSNKKYLGQFEKENQECMNEIREKCKLLTINRFI